MLTDCQTTKGLIEIKLYIQYKKSTQITISVKLKLQKLKKETDERKRQRKQRNKTTNDIKKNL